MNPYDNRSNNNAPQNEHEPQDGQNKLISGVYLRLYRRVLWLALPLAALITTGATLLANFFTPDRPWRIWILGMRINLGGAGTVAAVANIVFGVALAFIVITAVFIFLQKFNVDIGEYGKYADDCPDRNHIGPAGPIGEILLSIATTVLFLGFPFVMAGRFDGQWVPVFDTAALRAMWIPILLWMAFEIISEVTKLADREYNLRVCAVTVLCGIACALSALYVFRSTDIINPDFLYHIGIFSYDYGAPGWVVDNIVTQPNRIPLGILLAVIFFEVVDVVYYTAKFRIFKDVDAEE